MDIPQKCDVVVIGGGPGGSTAATSLAQLGYEVVVFEKARHPRYNIGESIIPHFWKTCDAIKVAEKIAAEGFIEKSGGTVVWNGNIRQMAFKDFGYSRPALHVERDRFDHILLEHTREQGAQVFEEVSALSAEVKRTDSMTVTYRPIGEKTNSEISCRYVVDASGQRAVLARQFGIRMVDEGFRFMSIWGYFKNSKYIASDGRAHDFDELSKIPPTTFVSNVDGWGWLWHIAQRESTSVGLVLPKEQMKSVKDADKDLEEYFLRRCREIPYLDRLLEPAEFCEGSFHVIRDYSYRPKQVTGPGFFLVGDAAAFVDPIFSIGVVMAMYSGYLASWAINRSLQTPKFARDSLEFYSRQLQHRIETSRALALPRYGVKQKSDDMVKTAFQWENSTERELMYVVSTLTTRSENFTEIASDLSGAATHSDKYKKLESIIF